MLWVNIIAIIILFFSFIGGLKEGAVKQFVNLLAAIIAIPLAGLSYHLLATVLAFLPGTNWENFIGFFVALAVFIAMVNFFVSAYRGKKAPNNPWKSRSPEWQISSPPPLHNYDVPLKVVGNPYDYGLKDSVYVKLGTVHDRQQN